MLRSIYTLFFRDGVEGLPNFYFLCNFCLCWGCVRLVASDFGAGLREWPGERAPGTRSLTGYLAHELVIVYAGHVV